ncbi:MAG TPA: cupin domain-containing protein [Luteimonas sp.]|nr:cupin domain-containing protein [Luteimonas sp.]
MTPRLLLLATALPLALFAATPPTTPAPPPPPAGAMAPMPPMPPMPPSPDMAAPAVSAHVMLDPAQLKWGDAPPALGKGAQLVVLSGDPGKAGPYVMRLKTPPGFKIALHWHPGDEHVTVISGDVSLRMGDGPEVHSHTFNRGGYALLPAKMHHAASTKGGMIVQVEGMGPFEINYVDPKDDPRNRMPAAKDAAH